VIDVTLEALRALGIKRPRIAVCGLNPHAGEGGILGREDGEVIAPVVQAYADAGEAISGPWAGDTVFIKLRAGQFDAVVAMFHDQGHIPVKLLGFHIDPATGAWQSVSGVNVTLGLPILRTSVDHGTAFDIAGRGIANADSLVDAIDYATQLVRGRSAPHSPGPQAHPQKETTAS
jgi:4-hydroxythreonine-4-phosphate dehydrogenase